MMMSRAAVCVLLFTALVANPVVAAEGDDRQDQVVVASTRNCPSVLGRTLNFDAFQGFTCGVNGEAAGQAVPLLDSGPFSSTWIFVHGNQIPSDTAVKRGLAVYHRVRACSSETGPIRFVIWSWPSERTTNRIKDAKLKAHRTTVESFLLGSYLAAVGGECPIRLVGYSFGARVVGGSLHLASGGQLEGYCLPHTSDPVAPYRVALLAAAIESDGFLASGRYRRGLDNAEHVLLMNNSRDKALKYFWILDSSKPKALGRTGLQTRPRHVTVHQYDWSQQIGKEHRFWEYLDRPIIVQRIAQALVN